MSELKEIERSIIKTYRKEIWARFVKAVKDYKMVDENDHIMVCISGGKDSFLLAKCMEELQKHGGIKFELEYVVMNPGYDESAIRKIKEMAKLLNLDIKIFDTDIFRVVAKIAKESPCYMCARMRRGYLYDKAKELNCNKIALGHHFDDVIETTLLSMFYGAEIKTMVPKVHSSNFKGLELIRPLYLVREKDILNWKNHNSLEFINCACDFTKSADYTDSKRLEVKKLISTFREKDMNIDYNIFKSMENVNLECVLGYKFKNVEQNFLEIYDKESDDRL